MSHRELNDTFSALIEPDSFWRDAPRAMVMITRWERVYHRYAEFRVLSACFGVSCIYVALILAFFEASHTLYVYGVMGLFGVVYLVAFGAVHVLRRKLFGIVLDRFAK
jgi:hypothetical protein